ncbi:hypothetical protein EON73_04430 [bacterium]|nr:MAG: hypothetical protein EON73_04430 [bacterium]
MSDIVEKVVDYYRLENKDFSDIVLQNKMNLYYATVIRKTDPTSYNSWIENKTRMLIEKGFVPPNSCKDVVNKGKSKQKKSDYEFDILEQ